MTPPAHSFFPPPFPALFFPAVGSRPCPTSICFWAPPFAAFAPLSPAGVRFLLGAGKPPVLVLGKRIVLTLFFSPPPPPSPTFAAAVALCPLPRLCLQSGVPPALFCRSSSCFFGAPLPRRSALCRFQVVIFFPPPQIHYQPSFPSLVADPLFPPPAQQFFSPSLHGFCLVL